MTELRLRAAALRATARLSFRAAAARASPTGARRCYTSSGDPQYAMAKRLEKRVGDMRLDKSFDSQVSGSITARLKREAEKRDRYERWREATDPSRKWMTTIFVLGSAGFAYWLGTFWPREPDPRSTLPLDDARAPELNTKLENMSAAWTDFIKFLGKDYVSTHEADIKWHMGSAWSTHQPQPDEKPFCIVFPGSTEEVAQVMKICHRRKIPVVGYSGGTSLEGNYAQTRKGICINFSRMDEIVALHKDDLDVVVQPGVRWEELNRELEKDGLFFPLDPGPNAMIGGMVGTGCSGTNAYRYGTMREWVISLTVVLADGTILKTRQRPRKSSAGYDLTRLFVGSEGTLGLVTEATLKLAVKPEATSVAVCSFPTIRHAANCVSKVVGQAVPIAAVEILDDKQIQLINAAGSTSRSWAEEPTLFFKFSGTPSGVKESVEQVQKLAKTSGGKKFEFARSKNEQDELWSARKEALWSTMAMAKEGHRVWTGDVAVPISILPDLIEQTQEDIRKSGLVGSIVGHAADGNFHTLLMYSKAQRAKAERVVHNMVRRAIDMEGTVTGEHGVGLIKRDYLPLELGDAAVDLMRQIKMALDPLCLLNCDKVIRIQRPKRGEVKDLKPEA